MSGLLLGFSGKMASGKTTTATRVLEELNRIDDGINNKQNVSTVEEHKPNYKIISFADALRKEVSIILEKAEELNSKQYTQLNIFSQIDKRIAKKLYEFINSKERNIRRTVMQVWGTDVRRAEDENYWVDKAINKALILNSQGYNVGIDDVRFDNEAAAILENNGLLIRLDISHKEQYRRLEEIRKKSVNTDTLKHQSETALDNYPYFSLIVNNEDNEQAEKNIISYIQHKV